MYVTDCTQQHHPKELPVDSLDNPFKSLPMGTFHSRTPSITNQLQYLKTQEEYKVTDYFLRLLKVITLSSHSSQLEVFASGTVWGCRSGIQDGMLSKRIRILCQSIVWGVGGSLGPWGSPHHDLPCYSGNKSSPWRSLNPSAAS